MWLVKISWKSQTSNQWLTFPLILWAPCKYNGVGYHLEFHFAKFSTENISFNLKRQTTTHSMHVKEQTKTYLVKPIYLIWKIVYYFKNKYWNIDKVIAMCNSKWCSVNRDTDRVAFNSFVKIVTVLVNHPQIVAGFCTMRIEVQSQLIHHHRLHICPHRDHFRLLLENDSQVL